MGISLLALNQLESHIFANTDTSDMQVLSRLQDNCMQRQSSLREFTTSSAMYPPNIGLLSPKHAFEIFSPQSHLTSFPWKRAVSDYESFLLSYFETVICATSTFVDDMHCNPLRSVVLPMAALSELTYHALLMMAAHYLQLVEPRYYQEEMKLRQSTLTKLREAVVSSGWCDDDVLLTVMILCSSDVSSHLLHPS